ncbi:cobalt-precorrin-5B (C(1))-methyltransferase [Methanomassiliicoccus luminyensis]|uniref:cobalt-precorrin-5B (C(1))-methyltransferase n=1 Tax=Methanomassiliicoccus luminyensis TaxID=1080712 RepID=UPI000368A14D|nr:cobalt-precorrin-5B (C(1))-methyltransferase [Methanomassiliicoccus luminyensis]
MKDPVSEFEYPPSWVEACPYPDLLALVESGLAVLTSSGQTLRRGFTTGTTASAACKAAVLSLKGEKIESVRIDLPCGLRVDVPAAGKQGRGCCAKYSGDYPSDVTAGAMFVAEAAEKGSGASIIYGKGIGVLSRDMGRYKKGEPAVSPSARGSIDNAVRQALEEMHLSGAEVRLEIVGGDRIALRTLNSKVGVMEGISVLGTTGLVEPWDDHLEESNLDRIASSGKVVLTTGRSGLKFSRLLFPEHDTVLVGSKIGNAVRAARGEVILCGLPALILKFIDPDVLKGTGKATVEELVNTPEWKGAMEKAFARSKKEWPRLRVVLLDRQGNLLGDSG